MKPELELGISNLPDASFKTFRLYQNTFDSHWHYHPELELVFFTKGKGMKFIGDDISLYNEGDLFLIGENLPHTFVSYEDENTPKVEAFCIQFSKEIFETFVECNVFKKMFQAAKRGISFPSKSEVLEEKIKQIIDNKGINAIVLLFEILEILQQLSNTLPILQQEYQQHSAIIDASTRLRTAIDFINTHYQEHIALQEIADKCHFSPNAFCRWFKQNMGLTFVDYLNKVRLTNVCQLLISTDFPVGQIALQTGFENISTLNRLFQQKLNTSPSAYRTNNKK
jgi:AraC-like DNA-binding protein